jgi:hypothetical protein
MKLKNVDLRRQGDNAVLTFLLLFVLRQKVKLNISSASISSASNND